METFVKRSLLFDFYGELLTEHQKQIYQEIVFDDFSISEVARDEGISRQGVHDLMRRCDRILEDYEARLHLVEKFVGIRSRVDEILELADPDASGSVSAERLKQIQAVAIAIREEL
ncbi:MAG: YlxM family DNA-binding protein [Eubacterium sp.]|nr:YlxM family DNA-binding protein [Eubacterium sp.]